MIPGDLDALTGGYGYDRRVIAGLRDLGWTVTVERLDDSFPLPTPFAREDARRRLAAAADDSLVLVDGLAFGALSVEAEREQARLRLIALVHHPLADETGIDVSTAASLEASERRALAVVRLVIVTSHRTAAALSRYGVNAQRVVVVEPGSEVGALAAGSTDGVVRLLCVASLIPRKGHEVLVKALATLRDRPWHLTCVGSVDRDAHTADRVRTLLAQYGMTERVTFTGDLHEPRLNAEYLAADVFVLPTFHEGYGMVVSEALAHGLPVISCPTGGIEELVLPDAGLLVSPGRVGELAQALAKVIDDRNLRVRLAEGARRVRGRLSSWQRMAERMAEALQQVRHA